MIDANHGQIKTISIFTNTKHWLTREVWTINLQLKKPIGLLYPLPHQLPFYHKNQMHWLQVMTQQGKRRQRENSLSYPEKKTEIGVSYTSVKKILRAKILCIQFITKKWENKHNSKLQRTDPGTKDMGKFSTRGRTFPHNAQNGFLLFTSL